MQQRNRRNYRITDADKVGVGSLKQKCRHNIASIELLKRLEGEDRPATDSEKRILVRYVGWGGLPQVFDQWNEEWKEERERLEALLTSDELDSARATTLNAHYTAPPIVRAMYAAVHRLGFQHGRILEPALGLGHFIGLMPDAMHARSLITGAEIDSLMRIMIGSIAAVTRPEEVGITSPDYVVVKPKPERANPVWFYEWLRSTHGAHFINSLARGAVRERMLFSRLRKGILPVPTLAAQKRFASVCSTAREAQQAILAQLAELSALPNALLREAFNGNV